MSVFHNEIWFYNCHPIDEQVLDQIFDHHPDRLKIKHMQGDTGAEDSKHRLDMQALKKAWGTPIRGGQIIDYVDNLLHTDDVATVLTVAGYSLDRAHNQLSLDDKVIDLTDREVEIMTLLLRHFETGCQRDVMLGQIWGYRADLDTHTTETHIYRLRQKIEDDPANPQRLLTIDNGYRLA